MIRSNAGGSPQYRGLRTSVTPLPGVQAVGDSSMYGPLPNSSPTLSLNFAGVYPP